MEYIYICIRTLRHLLIDYFVCLFGTTAMHSLSHKRRNSYSRRSTPPKRYDAANKCCTIYMCIVQSPKLLLGTTKAGPRRVLDHQQAFWCNKEPPRRPLAPICLPFKGYPHPFHDMAQNIGCADTFCALSDVSQHAATACV